MPFGEICRAGTGSVQILEKLLASLLVLEGVVQLPSRRQVLLDQLEKLAETAQQSIQATCDRQPLLRQIEQARSTLGREVSPHHV